MTAGAGSSTFPFIPFPDNFDGWIPDEQKIIGIKSHHSQLADR